VLGQAASPATQTYEAIAPTAILQTLDTRAAGSAIYDWLNDHSIARLVISHTVSDFFDNASELMTECQRDSLSSYRMRGGWAKIGATKIFVQISPANTYPRWPNLDLTLPNLGDWNVLVSQIVDAMESDSFHGLVARRRRLISFLRCHTRKPDTKILRGYFAGGMFKLKRL
jgi:hypothetical protein